MLHFSLFSILPLNDLKQIFKVVKIIPIVLINSFINAIWTIINNTFTDIEMTVGAANWRNVYSFL